jgi:hypothetical protein
MSACVRKVLWPSFRPGFLEFFLSSSNKNNSVALSPQANYTDWATATCWRNLLPTFEDRGVSHGQRRGSPDAEIISKFQVVTHCSTTKYNSSKSTTCYESALNHFSTQLIEKFNSSVLVQRKTGSVVLVVRPLGCIFLSSSESGTGSTHPVWG